MERVVASILGTAQSSRLVVQDFVPLAESLEWRLGQEYLRERGNKAFISDAAPVPFVINNDGSLSRSAAEVFFASLCAADARGELTDPDIFVLELGIGVGLFARFFLDCFRDLCAEHGKDYYHRLCYVAADRSARMLLDVSRHGVLANHPGRHCLRLVDAMKPEETLPQDLLFAHRTGPPFRAVFLNYLLDCLPAASLDISGDEVKQLVVRTCVARNVRLEDFSDLTIEMLRERVRLDTPKAQRELLEVYGLFASEYDYRPVDPKSLPLGDFAMEFARPRASRILHSYGAIQGLEKLLSLVTDDGIILINDYGQTQTTREDEFEHQRFSLATFVGVNFSLLHAYFVERKRYAFEQPYGAEEGIHSRLLSKKPNPEATVRFHERFGAAGRERLSEPANMARRCLQVGRIELAATHGLSEAFCNSQKQIWLS